MRTDTIDSFLETLAARVPAPGGGASAALHAAQSAALIAMVARYSNGEKYAQHAGTIDEVRDTADRLRVRALTLAEQDADAFGAVGAAYGLPKTTDEERTARSRSIAAALVRAGRVPAQVIALADELIELAQRLRPIGNPSVIADVAAAADAARAAASTARLNVEINIAGIDDAGSRTELNRAIGDADEILRKADHLTARVRKQVRT